MIPAFPSASYLAEGILDHFDGFDIIGIIAFKQGCQVVSTQTGQVFRLYRSAPFFTFEGLYFRYYR